MNFAKVGFLAVLIAAVLVACPPPPPPATGTLALNITGPTGVTGFAPNVAVAATGFNQTVTNLGNQNLTVPVGNATVTVNPVTLTGTIVDRTFPGRINVAGFPTSNTVSIAQGATTNVTVAYPNSALTGQLWFTFNTEVFSGFNDSLLSSSGGSITPTNTFGTAATKYTGMAFDQKGNVWVAEAGANKIQQFAPTGTLVQTITANAVNSINNPRGIAFDPAGNLWVANFKGNQLTRYAKAAIEAGTGTNALIPNATITTTGARFEQIAFDTAGNLWAIDFSPGRLLKYDAASLGSNPAPSVIMTGLANAYGLSIDSAGKFWIADTAGVKKYDPPTANGAPPPLATLNRTGNFDQANATAFDKNGNLWVADSSGVYMFTSAQITSISGATSLSPNKTFDIGGFARNLAFFPVPANLPIFK